MRQLVYIIYIRNNRTSFHLWWKENLVKYRKVSKYYETDCSSNFHNHELIFSIIKRWIQSNHKISKYFLTLGSGIKSYVQNTSSNFHKQGLFLQNHQMNQIKLWNLKKFYDHRIWGLETVFELLGAEDVLRYKSSALASIFRNRTSFSSE